jgi:hypothetical protein
MLNEGAKSILDDAKREVQKLKDQWISNQRVQGTNSE